MLLLSLVTVEVLDEDEAQCVTAPGMSLNYDIRMYIKIYIKSLKENILSYQAFKRYSKDIKDN